MRSRENGVVGWTNSFPDQLCLSQIADHYNHGPSGFPTKRKTGDTKSLTSKGLLIAF